MHPTLRPLAVAMLALATAGSCTAGTPAERLQKELVHMQYAQEPLVTHTEDGFTYTNAPQETWLGPHRFMIPANYFTDQMGPDFQGSVSMELEWPELEPLPPGRRRVMSMPEFYALVQAGLSYVDKLPWYESMEVGVNPPDDDPISRQSPAWNLPARTRGEDMHGLQRWYASEQDRQRFLALIRDQPPRRYGLPDPENIHDWYLRRDAQGHLVTHIVCAPPSVPNGLRIEGNQVVKNPGVRRNTSCDHSFAIPKYKVLVSVSYVRTLLPEWQRIEDTLRANLDRYYVGEGEGWKPWDER